MHQIKGKTTFANVGVISVFYAKLWYFDSDGLVNIAINDILEEESLCGSLVFVFLRGLK